MPEIQGDLRRDVGYYACDDQPGSRLAINGSSLEETVETLLAWVPGAESDVEEAGTIRITVEVVKPPDAAALAAERERRQAAKEAEGQRWRAEHPEEAARNDELLHMMIAMDQAMFSLEPTSDGLPLLSPLRNQVAR